VITSVLVIKANKMRNFSNLFWLRTLHVGEDSHSDHGLRRLVEFRFKALPGATSSSVTTHTT